MQHAIADPLQQFKHYLETIADIPDREWQQILPRSQVIAVETQHFLQSAKQPVLKHYFLCSGLVRLFYETLDGKDINKGFYGSGHMVGNLSALILAEDSRFAIQCLEPSVLVQVDLHGFNELTQGCPGFKAVFDQSCQLMLIRNERREAELLTMNAKQRFLQFHKNFPDLFDRIPQYHIASYLGITPVALSRYKKQWLQHR